MVAQAGDVQQPQQDLVTSPGLQRQHGVDVGLAQDPLGERVLALLQLDRGADVERQVAGALAEGEQRFHRGERARPGAGRQAGQRVRERLDVAERHTVQRRGYKRQEAADVGSVGALSGRPCSHSSTRRSSAAVCRCSS